MSTQDDYNMQALQDYSVFQRIANCYSFFEQPTFNFWQLMLVFLGGITLGGGILFSQGLVGAGTTQLLILASVIYCITFIVLLMSYISVYSHNQRILNNALADCNERQINLLSIKLYHSFNSIVDKAHTIAQYKAQSIQDNETFIEQCIDSVKNGNGDKHFNGYMEEAIYQWKALIDEQKRESLYQDQEPNYLLDNKEPPLVATSL